MAAKFRLHFDIASLIYILVFLMYPINLHNLQDPRSPFGRWEKVSKISDGKVTNSLFSLSRLEI